WEDLRMTSQGFKPGSGNPTVRHYRGALGNVRHGETETPSCNRKSGNGNPSPTAGRAQFLSQPSASFEARYAPRSYPTRWVEGSSLLAVGPHTGRSGIACFAQGWRRRAVGNRTSLIVDIRLDLLSEREGGLAFTV